MFKILTIGNSFSEDSTGYLHSLAKCAGIDLEVVNLFIGACSLERHWNNIFEDKAEYDYQRNGKSTGRYVGIKEVLEEKEWDIITMQQFSGHSGILQSYDPYITNISEYIRRYAPDAKQLMHQTWAYELDSTHEHFSLYHNNQEEMYKELVHCYKTVSEALHLDVIPFGEVIQKLRKTPPFDYKNRGKSLCRDGHHMHYIYGRYALAATWYEYVLKGNIFTNNFVPIQEDKESMSDEEILVIKQCVKEVCQEHAINLGKENEGGFNRSSRIWTDSSRRRGSIAEK